MTRLWTGIPDPVGFHPLLAHRRPRGLCDELSTPTEAGLVRLLACTASSLLPRALLAVAAASVVLWLPAEATLGHTPPDSSQPAGGEQVVDEGTVVDPETTVPDPTPSGPEPEQPSDILPDDTENTDTNGVVAGEDGSTNGSEPVPLDPGYGNAARQSKAAKQAEAKEDCSQSHPPVSRMLGLGGVVSADEDSSWHWLVIAIGVSAALFATAAFVIRRRRAAPGASPPPRGTLESIAALVAICAGLAGLAVQFVPGIGVRGILHRTRK
jgi:hypothetical protein